MPTLQSYVHTDTGSERVTRRQPLQRRTTYRMFLQDSHVASAMLIPRSHVIDAIEVLREEGGTESVISMSSLGELTIKEGLGRSSAIIARIDLDKLSVESATGRGRNILPVSGYNTIGLATRLSILRATFPHAPQTGKVVGALASQAHPHLMNRTPSVSAVDTTQLVYEAWKHNALKNVISTVAGSSSTSFCDYDIQSTILTLGDGRTTPHRFIHLKIDDAVFFGAINTSGYLTLRHIGETWSSREFTIPPSMVENFTQGSHAVRVPLPGGAYYRTIEELKAYAVTQETTETTGIIENNPTPVATQTSTPATTPQHNWATNHSAFTNAYTQAGNYEHPPLTTTINGPLTALTQNLKFGIEIEVDFPDSIPYHQQRNNLALALQNHNLMRPTELSERLRWHIAARRDNPDGTTGYTTDTNAWSIEHDRTVDPVNGARGCEIVSPILTNTPETWENINTIIRLIKEHGGQVSTRHGLHVNISSNFPNLPGITERKIAELFNTFEDVLIRMAHTDENGRAHRGRRYCGIVDNNPALNGHLSAINMSNIISNSPRIEFRFFDGTLDAGRIQANVMLCYALINAALNCDAPTGANGEPLNTQPVGVHVAERRARNISNGVPARSVRKLTGDQWKEDTLRFRELIDHLALNDEQNLALTILYRNSRWMNQ